MNKKYLYPILALLLLSVVVAEDLYNTTELDNTNNFYEYSVAINNLMDKMVGVAILFIVGVVAWAAGGSGVQGMAASGFITALSATILLPLQLIDFTTYQFVLLLCGGAVVMVYMTSGGK